MAATVALMLCETSSMFLISPRTMPIPCTGETSRSTIRIRPSSSFVPTTVTTVLVPKSIATT